MILSLSCEIYRRESWFSTECIQEFQDKRQELAEQFLVEFEETNEFSIIKPKDK